MRKTFITVLFTVAAAAVLSCGAVSKGFSATITVDPSDVKAKVNPLIYGQFIEHIGQCIKGGLWTPEDKKHKLVLGGVREDLYEAIKALNIPMLRWPGGCFSDSYHWEDGIGPANKRPLRRNLAWSKDAEESPTGPKENNAFGTDEFLRLCESLGIEPLINVNLGSGTAEEARRWVEYTNGGPETEMGKLRASNGHPAPYNVKYWGVGNENWGKHEIGYLRTGAEYAAKYLEFARAMKSADPDIKLLAVGIDPSREDWNKEVLEAAGAEMDFLSLHEYFPGASVLSLVNNNKKWLYYGQVTSGRQLDTIMDDFDAQVRKYSPAGASVITALDEWNLWWNSSQIVRSEDYNFTSAIFTGDILMRLMRRGDNVGFANFAQLVNVLALIVSDPDKGLFLTPSYYPFQLFRNYITGDKVVATKVESPKFSNQEYGIVKTKSENPYIEALAVAGEGGALDVVVINKHYERKISTTLNAGVGGITDCEMYGIYASTPQDMNSFANPHALKGIEKVACPATSGASMTYEFPPHSISLLKLKTK